MQKDKKISRQRNIFIILQTKLLNAVFYSLGVIITHNLVGLLSFKLYKVGTTE